MRKNIFTIEWERKAAKAFESISDKKLKEHVFDVLENVISHHPLIGKSLAGSLRGARSYRIGVIRVIYRFYKDRLLIIVLDIAHRKEVYRKV
jgi:mRNA interferase RelE/StbE